MAYKAFTRPVTGYIEAGAKEIKSTPGAASETLVTINNGCDVVEITGWDMDAADSYTVWQEVSGMENETGTPFKGYLKASDVKKKYTTFGIQENKGLARVYTKEEVDQIIADLEDTSEPKILIDQQNINQEVNNTSPAVMIDIPSNIADMLSILEDAVNVEVTINGSEVIKFDGYNFYVDGTNGYKHWFMASADKQRRFTLTLNEAEEKITLTYRMTSSNTGAKETVNSIRVYGNDFNIVISEYAYSKQEVDHKVAALQAKDTELDAAKSNKPTITDAVLSASGWTKNTYSLEATYPAAQYDLEIFAGNTSAEQYDALSAAKLFGSTSTNTLTALGTVPAIDIPIIIKAVKK